MLSEKQNLVLLKAKEGHNLAVLGQSGTGKTFLGKELKKSLEECGKKVALTATTGIAALNIGGTTIHRWSGIGDGRDSSETLCKKILLDESYFDQKRAISNTDALIIDEISMLSLKLFDTLEHVCRKIRDSDTYFGSIQVIVIGDFFQLPPVPDPLKGDRGEFCFLSERFTNTFTHCIVLNEVKRQNEIDFINCINEVSKGNMTDESLALLRRMKRPLPPGPPPVRLCAKKFDCDVYNASKLIDMQGETMNYVAEDNGEKKYLNSLSVPEILYLKKDCPVLLLKNLSDNLVNGLRGKITELSANDVTVYFDSLSKEVKLRPESFSVYCTAQEKVIATRIQIPLCLAFSITIHKAQGLTLDRIEVDGDNIFSPGQLGVAIGRTTIKRNLRIINFNPNSVLKHNSQVYEFCDNNVCIDFNEDLKCCKIELSATTGKQDQHCVELITYDVDEENQLSDFSHDEIQEIDRLCTAESNEVSLTNFENNLKTEIMDIFQKVHTTGGENLKTNSKSWTCYYSEVYKFSTSEKYKKLVEAYFGRKATTQEFQLCRNIFDQVSSSIIEEHTSHLAISQAGKGDSTMTISDTSHGKIRYIGGACVAKSKFHFMNLTRKSLYKNKDKSSNSYLKVKMLDHLCIKDSLISSKYPKSLLETERKQNISHGLTIVTDSVFEFFLELSKRRLKFHNDVTFALHGASCLTLCDKDLKEDTELKSIWEILFNDFDNPSLRLLIEEDSLQASKVELYEDIVTRFLKIGNNEFRKDILQKYGKEKSERLRKKVVSGQGNEKTSSDSSKKTNKDKTSEMPSTSQMEKREKVPRKRRSKSKAASGKRKQRKSKESEQVTCPKCHKVYVEGENWIACDLCDRWYDPICAALTDDQWADIENFDWYCAECQE
ncbi:uncharacterized protein LOC134246079 [Saccostrea cucullata]|uniref:uncharacterized protein LOC134246079 n=1 Tax=Saccostrea cuccullata TaxID=36930 RepID=UPI002ED34149